MERSQKEKTAEAAVDQKPVGPLWARNLRDLIVIVGGILGFAAISVLARPYLPKSAWTIIYAIGAAVVGIYIRSLARKKEPIQPLETTRGK
jgi:hypothetical protein